MADVRIAVLADIHGNAPALEAVLVDIDGCALDRVYVLGDVVNGGPEPGACWHAARRRADAIVRGNHERYVLSAHAGDPQFGDEAWGPAQWTSQRMAAADLEEIQALPTAVALDVGGDSGTLLCHASPRRDDDVILPDTPTEEVRPMLAGADRRTVVRGHNHIAFDRVVDGVRIISIGAVGLAMGTPARAEYAILEAAARGWTVEHRRVHYDVEATLRACRETGYLEDAGPVARLFTAEIATGRKHISPFMRSFYRASEHESLAAAIDAFMQ